jgi:hypothetical protein
MIKQMEMRKRKEAWNWRTWRLEPEGYTGVNIGTVAT